MPRHARVLTSRALWRAAVHVAAAFAVLFPIGVVALDHHGAERIGGHQHAVPSGETIPPHVHGFQIPHTHGPEAMHGASGAPAIVPAEPLLLTMFAPAFDAAVRAGRALPLTVAAIPRGLTLAPSPLVEQIALAPPTRPPDAPLPRARRAQDAG